MLTSKVTIRLMVSCSTNNKCMGTFPFLFMSSYHSVKATNYTEHFRTLELPEDTSTRGNVRRKYIELVKMHQPDTSKDNIEKFNQIEVAYRELMKKFQEDKEREEAMVGEYGPYYDKEKMTEHEEETDHPGIQHVPPQHRQFLDNAVGSGSPAQRQKQTQQYKVFKASEAVHEHRVGRLRAQHEDMIAPTRERATVKTQHTNYQIDSLVEEKIQASMAGGKFDNLQGKGEPLPNQVDSNPYTDFTTHKMNQILVETGFGPEWVELQKDIRKKVQKVRDELKMARQKMGPAPVNREQQDYWQQVCGRLEKEEVLSLNRMIEEFNLVVPIMDHQKFLFNLQSEAAKIYDDYDNSRDEAQTATKKENKSEVQSSSIFSGFFSMFK
eukprot:GFUD01009739.1.p1 GENE.GFUD01009739.1~~GFUD01009739.1.p1  ORF type:complete len:382 (-),score=119.37 GFUD01009739.1:173-1318(-)